MYPPILSIEGVGIRPDSVPEIRIEGCRPLQPVRLETAIADDDGVIWRAVANMYADVFGRVCSHSAASHGGTYRDVDPLGLTWSMIPEAAETAASLQDRCRLCPSSQPNLTDPHRPLDVTVTAMDGDGEWRAEATYQKHQVSPDLEISEIAEAGVHGIHYAPSAPTKQEGIIIMGGSGGGTDRYWARHIASLGYHTLNLAYFNYPGRPDDLARLPLETFKTAIDWMKHRTGCDRVALQGASRGGEAVLLIASLWPDDIACVVSYVPMHLMISGLIPGSNEKIASWTLNGKDLPYAPTEVPRPQDARDSGIDLSRGLPAAPFYLETLMAAEKDDGAWIPVERAKAPILLISATDDLIWPCTYGAERVVERTKRLSGEPPIEHLALQGAGHITPPTGTITSLSTAFYHPHARAVIGAGGTSAINAKAGQRAWERCTAFYGEHLR